MLNPRLLFLLLSLTAAGAAEAQLGLSPAQVKEQLGEPSVLPTKGAFEFHKEPWRIETIFHEEVCGYVRYLTTKPEITEREVEAILADNAEGQTWTKKTKTPFRSEFTRTDGSNALFVVNVATVKSAAWLKMEEAGRIKTIVPVSTSVP